MLQQKKIYFPHLDGLRFVAFFVVFLGHSFHTTLPNISDASIYQILRSICRHGYLGVNFFFVLSGFLITYLLLHEQRWQQKINVGYFYMRRILRIWPLYFSVVFFGFVLFPLLKTLLGQSPNETASLSLFLTFLSNFNNLWHGPPDASMLGVLWSVSIEEQFYLVWPVLLAFVTPKRYMWLFVVVILLSLSARIYYMHDASARYFHTLCVISDMAVGAVLAYASFNYSHYVLLIKNMPQKYIVAAYFLGFIGIILLKTYPLQGPLLVAERLLLAIFFAFVVAEQCFAQHSWYKMGNYARISYWGRYTYGLYCLHFIGILVALTLSKKMGTHRYLWGVLLLETVLALGFSMLLSWCSYHYLEAPFLRLKKRFAFIVQR